MKKLFAAVSTAAIIAMAGPALSASIIVVAHGQANDPF